MIRFCNCLQSYNKKSNMQKKITQKVICSLWDSSNLRATRPLRDHCILSMSLKKAFYGTYKTSGK